MDVDLGEPAQNGKFPRTADLVESFPQQLDDADFSATQPSRTAIARPHWEIPYTQAVAVADLRRAQPGPRGAVPVSPGDACTHYGPCPCVRHRGRDGELIMASRRATYNGQGFAAFGAYEVYPPEAWC